LPPLKCMHATSGGKPPFLTAGIQRGSPSPEVVTLTRLPLAFGCYNLAPPKRGFFHQRSLHESSSSIFI
jgi:hypothetical protein